MRGRCGDPGITRGCPSRASPGCLGPRARAGLGSGGAREREELLWAGDHRVEKVKGRLLQEVESRKRAARAAERR